MPNTSCTIPDIKNDWFSKNVHILIAKWNNIFNDSSTNPKDKARAIELREARQALCKAVRNAKGKRHSQEVIDIANQRWRQSLRETWAAQSASQRKTAQATTTRQQT